MPLEAVVGKGYLSNWNYQPSVPKKVGTDKGGVDHMQLVVSLR